MDSTPACSPLPFLNEKRLKGVVDSISKDQRHLTYWLLYPPFNTSGNISMELYFS